MRYREPLESPHGHGGQTSCLRASTTRSQSPGSPSLMKRWPRNPQFPKSVFQGKSEAIGTSNRDQLESVCKQSRRTLHLLCDYGRRVRTLDLFERAIPPLLGQALRLSRFHPGERMIRNGGACARRFPLISQVTVGSRTSTLGRTDSYGVMITTSTHRVDSQPHSMFQTS